MSGQRKAERLTRVSSKRTEQLLNLTVTAHRTLPTNVFIIGRLVRAVVETKVSLKLQANSKRID